MSRSAGQIPLAELPELLSQTRNLGKMRAASTALLFLPLPSFCLRIWLLLSPEYFLERGRLSYVYSLLGEEED